MTLWYLAFDASNSSPTPPPMAAISASTSVFFSILSKRERSTFKILPRIGKMAWVSGLRAATAEPPAESPSTMNSSHSFGSRELQSFSLSGIPAPSSADLRRMALRASLAALRATECRRRLLQHCARFGRVLFEPLGQLVVGNTLHHGPGRNVTELALGLTFELRVPHLHRHDRCEAFTYVFAQEVLILFLDDVSAAAVLVHDRGEGGLEAFDMHATFGGGDTVGVPEDSFVVAGVPLHGDLDRHLFIGVFTFELGHLFEE